MKRINIIALLLISNIIAMNGQKTYSFEKKWKAVESDMANGLPKSALEKVDDLYRVAQKTQNQEQIIKSVVYRAGLILSTKELGLERVVDDLNTSIDGAVEPSKSILRSYAAELMSNYFNQNLYSIQQRTDLEEPTTDIRTWSANNYRDYISRLYQSSLQGKLHTYRTESYKSLIANKKNADFDLRPTLYDLLLDRALRYYNSTYLQGDQGIDRFYINDPKYFDPHAQFSTMDTSDFPAFDMNAQVVKLYVDALSRHDGRESIALAMYDVQRLEFIHRNYTDTDIRDSLYVEAMERGEASMTSNKAKAIYAQKIVETYFQKNKFKEALEKIKASRSIVGKDVAAYFDTVEDNIWSPSISGTLKQVYPREGLRDFSLMAKNVEKIEATVLRVDYEYWINTYDRDKRKKYLRKQKAIHSWTIPVDNATYEVKKIEGQLPRLPYGHYVLLLKDGNKSLLTSAFWISDIAYAVYNNGDSQVVVMDRTSGKPLQGATLKLYERHYNRNTSTKRLVTTYKTDDRGIVDYNTRINRNLLLEVVHGDDKLNLSTPINSYDNNGERDYKTYQYFTDRAIYRPGQVLHVKLMAMNIDSDQMPALARSPKEEVLILNDANGQVVAEQTVRFNHLSTGTARFVLPKDLLNGVFSLSTKHTHSYYSIRVEEYKRPTLEIEVDTIQSEVQLDKELTITGRSKYLSGVPVQGGKVHYKIVRYVEYGWGCYHWYYQPPSEDLIAVGEVVTDASGDFRIPFVATSDGKEGLFTYRAELSITDANGETQTTDWTIKLGNRPYNLTIDGEEVLNLDDSPKLKVAARNAQGVDVPVKANIIIYRARKASQGDDVKGAEVRRHTMDIRSESTIELSDLPSGEYIVRVESDEVFDGNRIAHEKRVVLYSHMKKQYPVAKTVYINQGRIDGAVGKDIDVNIGTSDPATYVWVKVVRRDKVLKEEWIKVDNHGKLTYRPTSDDIGGVTIHYMYVKNNASVSNRIEVSIPWTHKELDVQLITSKDITKPGSKESWKLKIHPWQTGADRGEVVATMYDASLDLFVKHKYYGLAYPNNASQFYEMVFGFGDEHLQYLKQPRMSYPSPKGRLVPQLIAMYQPHYGSRLYKRSASRMESDAAPMMSVMAGTAKESASMFEDQAAHDKSQNNAVNVPDASSENEGVRENLDELVFFYPQLPIGKDGTVELEFKMNDALTRWKMLVFAHDSKYRTGSIEHEVVTQKELMVMPNISRFVREGDRLLIPVTIYNLTDQPVTSKVELELSDKNGKVVNTTFDVESSKEVSAPANGSIKTTFSVSVPAQYKDAVRYEVSASTAKHKDVVVGELPILSKGILITETKTVRTRPSTTQEVDASWLKQGKDITPHRIVVEYTSNPIWYVVKALPALAPSDHDETSSTQVVNALYAHGVARYVAKSQPRINSVIEQWQSEDQSLTSNLERNEDLHKTSLGATPWVRQSQRETLQRKSLITLFDDNASAYRQKTLIQKLKELQNTDGGISWYPGSRSSVYTTQYVMEYLAKMKRLGVVFPSSTEDLELKALDYMEKELEDRYNKIAKLKLRDAEKHQLDPLSLQYLYVVSFYNYANLKDSKAYKYFYQQMKEYWTKHGLMEQSMMATVLYRNGDKTYKDIMKSLTERSFTSPELGTYWNQGNGYHWYDLPIETHAALMTLYDEVGEKKNLEDMAQWLLQNKETNEWETDQGTAAACYAVLKLGQEKFVARNSGSDISINGKFIDSAGEEGTGYTRIVLDADELARNPLRSVSFSNSGDQIGWGAVYYEYYQDASTVKGYSDNPLVIRKELYREVSDDQSTRLVKVRAGDILNVGDRVVSRIEIKTDRAMDYVQVKDMRPSGVEPESKLSGYFWSSNIGYYKNIRDTESCFYIEHLPKGTIVLELRSRIAHKGKYSAGISSVQCFYAPKYRSHSNGSHIHSK